MSDTIDAVKSRLDIVEVISGYLKVQKSGANLKARCPFHNEKTPSFYISPERQIWHCFGCSKGGDMLTFVQEIEGVEFPEALRILAAKAGVEIDRYDRSAKNAKTRLFEVCEAASAFFEKQLWQSPTGQKALAYLRERGLTDETIKEFRLGFAPNDWHALGGYLGTCGYKAQEIIDAGMAIRKETSDKKQATSYDRFRSRITFPIADVNGQIVGFTARVFEETRNKKQETGKDSDMSPVSGEHVSAKYINTPQTAIYDKGRILFGLAKAKLDIKQADKCLLVEGNMDAIMSWQGGVRNVVATSGTALTPQQLRLLQRYTTNLDFCFDTDQAGAMATRRGIGLALSQNFAISVVALDDPECKDPADYVRKHGSGWAQACAASRPVIEFYLETARASYDPSSAASKKSVVEAVAPFINRLVSHVERSHWVAQLAGLLRAPEEAIAADLATAKDDLAAYDHAPEKPGKDVAPVPRSETVDMLNEALLSVIMKQPTLFKSDVAGIDMTFLDPEVAGVMRKLVAAPSGDTAAFMKGLREEHQSYRFEFAYIKSQELWKDFKDEELKAEFYALLHKIKQKAILSQLAALEFDIKEAEVRKDSAAVDTLAERFTELARQLADIHKV